MPMLDLRAGDEYGRPAARPRPVAGVQILDVGGVVDLLQKPERPQLSRIVQGASTAPVEHVAPVLADEWDLAAHRKIGDFVPRHDRFTSLLAPCAGRKKNLCRGAE